tara:strand:+ start:753 stop:1922 length:1170 start_codon:yes stop_codon:yes gene_type:complete
MKIRKVYGHSRNKVLCYVVNAGWYFNLHWQERLKSSVADGWKVFVIYGSSSNEERGIEKVNGVEYISVPCPRGVGRILNYIGFSLSVTYHLFRINPEVVHSITVFPNVICGFFCLLSRKPSVRSVTGTGWAFSAKGLFPKIIKNIISVSYFIGSLNKKSKFVFENPDDLSMFVDKGLVDSSSAHLILGAGVDTDIYRPFPGASTSGHRFTFLFAARLLKSKGLGDLVEAASLLYGRRSDFSVKVCGMLDPNGVDSFSDVELARIKEMPFIDWFGEASDMQSIFSEIDVLVLPSSYGEGVPRILIEASSCGVPSITTDLPGCNSIIVDGVTGFLVTPRSPYLLAERMEYLLDNPYIVKVMGIEGRSRVLKYFDQSIVVKKTLSLYKDIAN